MTISEVGIGNLALDLIGNTSIVSFDDTSKAARLIKRNYPVCRDRLLRSYRWNFAITRAQLAPDSTAPLFGFTHAFRKPADMVHFIGVYEDGMPVQNYTSGSYAHKLEGDFILANVNPLDIFYTKEVTDPAQFDAFFIDLLAIDIASRIGYGLTSGTQKARDLRGEREQVLMDARIADAFEGSPEIIETNQWLDAHDGYRYGHQGLRNRNSV